MPRKTRAATTGTPDAPTKTQPFRVLVVDPEASLRPLIERCGDAKTPIQVVHAATVAEARALLSASAIDLALIEPDLPDGSGLQLADELHRSRKMTQTIVVTHNPTLEAAMQAIRAGAADYLVKPLDFSEVAGRVRAALRKQQREKLHAVRIRRLRRLCKKLDTARREVSEQVDILCHDLVTAYQDLAVQMQQVAHTSEYAMVIRDELDLEKLLRRTLEYLVEKAGPTNAAIFLPSSMDEFSLGGYVNFDCTPESADMLLQHLGDVFAPRVGKANGVVHVTDNACLAGWLGDDATWLEDRHVIAFGCQQDGEALAIVTLFRDADDPFPESMVETCEAIAPMLGDALSKLIRIHHRASFGIDDADETGAFGL